MKKQSDKYTIKNGLFSIKLINSYSKPLLWYQILAVPLHIFIAVAAVWLPKIVAEGVIRKDDFQVAVTKTIVVSVLLLIVNLLLAIMANRRYVASDRFNMKLFLIKMKKTLYADYSDIESVKFRQMMDRADDALWGSSKGCKVEQMSAGFFLLLENVIGYFIFGLLLAKVNIWITVVITVAALVNYYGVKWILAYQYKKKDETAYLDKKLWYLIHIMGNIQSAKDIRVYGLGEWIKKKYKTTARQRLDWDKNFSTKYYISGALEAVFILLRDGLAYIILIRSIIKGNISLDEFILYFGMVGSLATWIGGFLNKINSLNETSFSVNDFRLFIEELYQHKSEKIDGLDQEKDAIVFAKVSYSFEETEAEVLHKISLKIKKGEKIALVGENGAGKTTLIKLLCGLYRPTEGHISVFGDMLGDSQDEYFKQFSVVFQDLHFLPISIAQFISGKETLTTKDEEKVANCICKANLKEKIDSLPKGIHTLMNRQIHEDGIELSGGEKQRLLLARAIYKDGPILILDEPTSSLDPIAENNLYKNYNSLCEDKTSIFISHRLTSTLFCDRIIYLEQGKIVECGTFDELMELNGKYAGMFRLQQQYYSEKASEVEDGPAA